MESAQNNLNVFKQNLNLLVTEPWGGWDVSFMPVNLIENLIDRNFYLINQNKNNPEITCSFKLLKIKIKNEKISEKVVKQIFQKIESFQQVILPSETIETIFSFVQKKSFKEVMSLINMVSCSKQWRKFAREQFIPFAASLLSDKILFYDIEDKLKAMPNPFLENDLCQEITQLNMKLCIINTISKQTFNLMINGNVPDGSTYLEKAIVYNYHNLAIKLMENGAELKMRCSVADMSKFFKNHIKYQGPNSLKLQVALIQNGAQPFFYDSDQKNLRIENILQSPDLECQDVVNMLLDTIVAAKPSWIELAVKKGWGEIACKIIDKIEIEEISYPPKSCVISELIQSIEKCGRVDILTYLIERLAQMESISTLQMALEHCKSEKILDVLLESSVNLPIDGSLEFLSLFHQTLMKQKYDFACKLLDQKRINLQMWKCLPAENPLQIIYNRFLCANPDKTKKIILKLIENGAVTLSLHCSKFNYNNLLCAINEGHTEIALEMIKNNAAFETSDFIGSLKYAIEKSMKEVAIALLQRGSALKNEYKNEPLEWLNVLQIHVKAKTHAEAALIEELIQHFT